jgi:hypothetical protein
MHAEESSLLFGWFRSPQHAPTRRASEPQEEVQALSQSVVLAVLSQFVQLQVDRNPALGPHFGQFRLELGHPATQPRHFENESLIRAAAYITQQSARHFATFHVRGPAQAGSNSNEEVLAIDREPRLHAGVDC